MLRCSAYVINIRVKCQLQSITRWRNYGTKLQRLKHDFEKHDKKQEQRF